MELLAVNVVEIEQKQKQKKKKTIKHSFHAYD